jgi:hypothetical protein
MKRTLLVYGTVGLLAAGLAGCNIIDGSDFEGSTPTAQTVALNVPGGGGTAAAGDGIAQSALLGDEADSYKLTRAVTAVVNGGTGAVLLLVRTIVSFPPSSRDGDTAVWGPHSEPLAKNAWRLTVTRLAKHQFSWVLDGKAKMAGDDAFVTILSGTHTRAVDGRDRRIEHFGSGNFTIDWDTAMTLPEHEDNRGVATFTYSRLPGAAETIDVDFDGVQDDKNGEIFNAVYRYSATPGSGGELRYGAIQDSLPEPGNTGTAKETSTIHSRWMETGAGRSDYRVMGEDVTASLGGPGTVSECWDTGFASVFLDNNYNDATKKWGVETSCVFPTADFSSVTP